MSLATVVDTTSNSKILRMIPDRSDSGQRLVSNAMGYLPYAKIKDEDGSITFGGTQSALWRMHDYCAKAGSVLDVQSTYGERLLERACTFQDRKRDAYKLGPSLLLPGVATQPWEHQSAAMWVASGGSPVYYAMGMGTGKSLVTVGASCYASHQRILILCPRSVLRVWPREFRNHAPGVYEVIHLEKGSMAKKIEEANHAFHARAGKLVVVVNYDSYRNPAFVKWATGKRWDLVVCDEAHRIKSPFGVTARSVHKLYGCSGQRFCLSGTPMPHDPLDIWSQCAFLDPGLFGTAYTRFRSRYAKIGFFKNVEGFVNQEELSYLFSTIAFHVPADVVSLPEVTHTYRTFELQPKTMRAYNQFRQKLAAEIEGGVVTAANALVKAVRLQQMTSGFYVNEDGILVDLQDREKEKVLTELLSDDIARDEKVVVFTRFHRDLDAVRAVTEAAGRKYGELSGRQNDLDENACFPQHVDVLGVNIASGGVGVDLTLASHAVLYSLSWSAAEFDQALKRLHRHGQRKHVTFTHLVAEGTIDEAIYEAIRVKRDLADSALRDTILSSIIGSKVDGRKSVR